MVFWDAVTGSEVARLPAHEEILVNCHCLALLNEKTWETYAVEFLDLSRRLDSYGTYRSMLICVKTSNREAQERRTCVFSMWHRCMNTHDMI